MMDKMVKILQGGLFVLCVLLGNVISVLFFPICYQPVLWLLPTWYRRLVDRQIENWAVLCAVNDLVTSGVIIDRIIML